MRVKQIKADRALRAVPGFEPKFVNYPIVVEDIEVYLTPAELKAVEMLVAQGFGRDVADVVRKGFMLWHNARRPRNFSWARFSPE